MFKLSLICGRNSSQSWRGQSISAVGRVAMRCSLKVAMTHLAALTQWMCGGTSWMLIDLDSMYFLTAAEHLLSMMFNAGW